MGNFVVLLTIFIFIYALLGMQLYSNQIKFDADNNPVPCSEADLELCAKAGSSPRDNFDTFGNALTTVFILIVADEWTSIMADYVRSTSFASELFFISLDILGNIILLNLFLAILLRQFKDNTFEKKSEQSKAQLFWQKVRIAWREAYGLLKKWCSEFSISIRKIYSRCFAKKAKAEPADM